jgi:hypothetical protein
VTAVVLLGDIVERPTQRYLVTEVLNMWEVSMLICEGNFVIFVLFLMCSLLLVGC